jgi:threonine dehydrogenase-like Zn-dependent dehydrogenase
MGPCVQNVTWEKTLQALIWNGQELRREANYVQPVLREGNAVVKVSLAGICSTDLQIFRGYMDFRGVPGHEFVGTVSAGPDRWLGRRVVGEINFGCGRCDFCRRNLGRHCPTRSVMGILNADGAFAEYVSIPVANLHDVPSNVSDEEAVFTEPLAAAFQIPRQVQINPGDEILILGDGKLGFLCVQALKLTGATVTAVGKHAEKLDAIRRCAVRTIRLDEWKPKSFDLVVDATGSVSGLQVAMSAVRPRGTLVLKSTIAEKHHIWLAPLVIHEITVVGSRCGPFAEALRALAEKCVAVTPLIEKIYPLAEGVEAVAHASRPEARKILLRC